MSDPVRWSILVAHLAERQASLAELLDVLLPQAAAGPGVEVVALCNNGGSLHEIRQALLDDARGEWVSFVDDDDLVSEDFVATVCGCLDQDPDFVAFQHLLYPPGSAVPDSRPVVTGIGITEWQNTSEAYIRGVTHVNPIRTSLARQSGFQLRGSGYEDKDFVAGVLPLLKTQVLIDRPLYHYRQSGRNPMIYQPAGPPPPRLRVDHPCFRWHPASLP